MIFVTVGTHEQPFNRLIQKVDELKKDGVITEDVIIQTGFSTYEPKYCQWSKLIPYQQMIKNVADARIVIHMVAQQVLSCRCTHCNHPRWPSKFCYAASDWENTYCCATAASVQ